MFRAFGERVARNMPIQGTAAHIIKIAMVRVDRRLYAEEMESRLILQVHDELIVESTVGRGRPGTANCNGGDGARLQYGACCCGPTARSAKLGMHAAIKDDQLQILPFAPAHLDGVERLERLCFATPGSGRI